MATSPVVSIWSLDGRSSRSDYFVVLLITGIIGSISGSMMVQGGAIGLFSGAIFVAVLWVSMCACVRRMHDVGHSGWWTLVALIPVANFIFGLYALLAPGQANDNEFGPPTSKQTQTPSSETKAAQNLRPASSLETVKAEIVTDINDELVMTVQEPMEEFWAQALNECESTSMKAGLWAKAYADAGGDERLAKAMYMRLRATQLQEQHVENQKALKLIRDQELLAEQERQKTLEVAAPEAKMTEEERAKERLPKGTCPACDEVIPLSSEQCPSCSALFTADSNWKVQPLTYQETLRRTGINNDEIDGPSSREDKAGDGMQAMVLFVLLFLLLLAAVVQS